jgi:GcrA cell cycle regulator
MTDIANLNADPWSREDIDNASRMWINGGLSAGKIAVKIGKTRNAVVGIAFRNRGLFPARVKSHGFSGQYKKKDPEQKTRPPGWRAPPRPVLKVVESLPTVGELNFVALPFAQIPRGRCKFPMDDADPKRDGPGMLCCGMPSMNLHGLPGDRKASNCEMHFRIGNSGPRVTNRE